MKFKVAIIYFFISFLLVNQMQANILGGTIVLTQPSKSIAGYDWDLFAEKIKPKLGYVFDYQVEPELFNLEVEVHGAYRKPYPQLQTKNVTLFDLPDENGDKNDALFTYAIGGYYIKGDQTHKIAGHEYLCKVRVDMPINNRSELIYRYNFMPKTLTNEHAMTYDLMDYYAEIIFKNVREICYVGYWNLREQQSFNSYKQVVNYLMNKIRRQILSENPELEVDSEALHKQMLIRFKQLNDFPVDEQDIPLS